MTNSTDISCGFFEAASTGCEMTNLITMQWELLFAFIGAIALAGFFYWRENVQREKSDALIRDATKTLKETIPMIEQQKELIKKQEELRKSKILRCAQQLKSDLKIAKSIVENEYFPFPISGDRDPGSYAVIPD